MSTRKTSDASGPMAQNRYMSSPEFAELRGVNGICVKDKAAITPSAAKRKLLWALQSKSLQEGGLKQLGRDLVAMFPERLGTPTMHRIGIQPGTQVSWEVAGKIHSEMGVLDDEYFPIDDLLDESLGKSASSRARRPVPMANLLRLCAKISATPPEGCGGLRAPSMEEFLIDLCVNPRIHIKLPGEDSIIEEFELERAKDHFRDIEHDEFKSASLPYFKDIIGALLDYFNRHEAEVKNSFQLTQVGRQIWKALDFALKNKCMVLVDGLEGRGKTEAAKAWCHAHLGEARFVSLKGINSKTAAFREIAKALGVASSYTRNAFEMQARVEDLLERSKLMLVVDEAHWLFNQSARVYTRPELVDWVVTGICNRQVPIALVTTPQFLQCMARVIEQVGWNHKQFQRRVARRVVLPAKNKLEDIEAIARSVFPLASSAAIKQILGYVLLSKRDLSAFGDVVRELRNLLDPESPEKADLAKARISLDQVEAVIRDELIPSDSSFAQDLAAVLNQPGRKPRKARGAPRALPDLDPEESERGECAPDNGRGNALATPIQSRSNGGELIPDQGGRRGETTCDLQPA